MNTPPLTIKNLLAELNIAYQWFDTEPCERCEESAAFLPDNRPGVGTKNLVLQDRKRKNYFLLVTEEHKTTDLKQLAEQLQTSRLSLVSAETLQHLLGVSRGSVSLFALVNDPKQQVQLLLDETLMAASHWDAHPNRNDAVLILSQKDWRAYLAYLKRDWQLVTV